MMRWVAMWCAVALMVVVTGCNKKHSETGRLIMPDPAFSWNLVEVPSDWPDEKRDWAKDPDLALRQQNVYEVHGRPDYFRLLWFRDGRIVADGDVAQLSMGKRGPHLEKFLRSQNYEWVYLDKGMAFQFQKARTKETPVPDEWRTIAEYGDPNDVKEVTDVTDGLVTKYTYYSLGRIFHFRDGERIREESVQSVPGVRMRR